jgi:type IV pilus assembly protein PilM
MARRRTSQNTVIGLDIEPGYIAAADVAANGTLALSRGVVAPLELGIMREGEVTDPAALAEALRSMFAENDLDRRVRLGVANQRIAVRTLDLPLIEDPNQLDAAVRFQAQDTMPMPLDQAVLDYQPLGRSDTAQGPRTRVVVVAAQRDMIGRLLEATRGAGLRPVGIDLSAFAMIRALAGGVPDDGGAAYLNVGGLTNMAVAEGATCRFARVLRIGVETMAAQLAERRGLTLEHARQWLQHVGLSSPMDSIEGDPDIVTQARAVLGDSVRAIADDVRNSIDYYRSQDATVTVERVVLTGPGVAIAGFADQLSADLGLAVESATLGEARPGVLAGSDAGQFTVAAGLAIEEPLS